MSHKPYGRNHSEQSPKHFIFLLDTRKIAFLNICFNLMGLCDEFWLIRCWQMWCKHFVGPTELSTFHLLLWVGWMQSIEWKTPKRSWRTKEKKLNHYLLMFSWICSSSLPKWTELLLSEKKKILKVFGLVCYSNWKG